MEEEATVSILLLGDSEVGKSAFFARVANGVKSSSTEPLPRLLDSDQPFVFNVWNKKRLYRLECYDTSSPDHYTTLRPNVVVLCFSVADRSTLKSVHRGWKHVVETHFNYDELLPVMVLGFKRDLRCENDPAMVLPQEGVSIAQQMRCDKYAECSSTTGELCKEAWEDLIEMAVGTTKEGGGKTVGAHCIVL